MVLFTKPDCLKCHYVKDHFDLSQMGIKERSLTPDDPSALAELAFYECVELAETGLPILVTDQSDVFSGAGKIKSYLASISWGKDSA